MAQVLPSLLGRGVDESHEIDPVLRVLEKLTCDQLPDVSRTDDDRVLEVGDFPS